MSYALPSPGLKPKAQKASSPALFGNAEHHSRASLPAGETAVLAFQVQVTDETPNPLVNQAEVTGAGVLVPITARAEVRRAHAEADVTPIPTPTPEPILAFTKTADRADAAPGDVIAYTLTATNVSPAPVTDLILRDSLPDGLVYVPNSAGSVLASSSQPVRSRWNQAHPTQSPPPRHDHAMAYDSRRQVVVLFGGCGPDEIPGCANFSGDTWEYDGTTWRQVSTPVSPPARYNHTMTFDSRRGVVVLFGGTSTIHGEGDLDDTWEFDGTNWVQVATENMPPRREMHAMAYDGQRGVTVLFGGRCYRFACEVDTDYDDTWEYDGTDWHQVTPDQSPPPSWNHQMFFDLQLGVTVMVGSFWLPEQTWSYDGRTWQQGPSMPRPRGGFALTYDSQRGAGVLFGGYGNERCGHPEEGDNFCDDTWEYDDHAWSQTFPATSPSGRSDLAMAYDAARQRVVMFGGVANLDVILGDTWEYEISTEPPATIYVDASNQSGSEDGSSEHPFNTIQEGIDAATGGDTVSVAPGTYQETIVMKPTVVLRSQGGPETTTIDSGGASPVVTCGDRATLDGFTVTGARGFNAFGIRCEAASPILSNNIVRDNDNAGVGLFAGSDALVMGNRIEAGQEGPARVYALLVGNSSPVIRSNRIEGAVWVTAGSSDWPQDFRLEGNVMVGGPIDISPSFAAPSGGNRIANNWIIGSSYINASSGHSAVVNNTFVQSLGIFVQSEASMEIINNIFVNGTVENNSSGNITVAYNDIFGQDRYGRPNTYAGRDGNISVNPMFVNPATGDYHLSVCSPLIDAGTDAGVTMDIDGDSRPRGKGIDIGADEYAGLEKCYRVYLPAILRSVER